MTGRQKLERRLAWIRAITYAGFALYLLPILAYYFFPHLPLLGGAGIGALLCVASLWLAFDSLRCPDCNRKLGDLLMVRQQGRLLALPRTLATCPHCGHDLDSYGSHDGLSEIVSGYEAEGRYVGVLDVPAPDGMRRYNLVLSGGARHAVARILSLQPFDHNLAGGYRYFVVPPRHNDAAGSETATTIRVEKGDQVDLVKIAIPQPLATLFGWLGGMEDGEQIVAVERTERQAA